MSESAKNIKAASPVSLGTTITQLDLGIKLTGRAQVLIKNSSTTDTLYILAQNSSTAPVSLTAANAMRVIGPGGLRTLEVDSNIDVYGVMSAAGPTNVYIWQADEEVFEDGYASQTTGGQEITVPMFQVRTSDQTAGTNGTNIQGIATSLGKQVVMPFANPENSVNGTGTLTTTVVFQVIAAPGAGKRLYITSLEVGTIGVTGGTAAEWRSGSTAFKTIPSQNTSSPWSPSTQPYPIRLGANEALNVVATFAAGTVYVNATGYIASE